MDKVSQSNARNAEDSASAAEELNTQAISLKEAVAELGKRVSRNANSSMAGTHTIEQAARKISSFRPVASFNPVRNEKPAPDAAGSHEQDLNFKNN
jgi:methyl-accepting chemotaxis protein